MLYLSIALLTVGMVLLGIEIFIPGFGVFGILGLVLILASAVVTVLAVPFGAFILLGELALIALIFYAMYRYIRKHQLYGKLILTDTVNDEIPDIGGLELFTGREGTTKTALRPYGTAEFNGTSLEVCADGGYIDVNTRVKVKSVEGKKVIVQNCLLQ